VRAKWTRPIDNATCEMRPEHLVRYPLLLDPLLGCALAVEVAGAVAPGAVVHTRNHEQTDRIRSLLHSSHSLHHAGVIVDAVSWWNKPIAPAVIHQDLSATPEECFEIR